jgi:hypothetical protein
MIGAAGLKVMKTPTLASAEHPVQLTNLRAFRPTGVRNPWTARQMATHQSSAAVRPRAAAPAASLDAFPVWPASERLDQLFQQRSPVLLLERTVSERIGADAELWQTGCFQGEVYPDLPIATTWRDLVQRLFKVRGMGQPPQPPACLAAAAASGGAQQLQQQQGQQRPWLVCTIAAQCRSRDQLRAFMLSAAGVDFMGDAKANSRGADALLFVSGSHPARSLPVAGRCVGLAFALPLSGLVPAQPCLLCCLGMASSGRPGRTELMVAVALFCFGL